MSRALPILKKQVDIYYSQPDRYPALAAAAWEWRTSDFYEARIRSWALLEGPRDAEWVGRAVRVALEESDAGAAGDLYVWGSDSFHLEELVNTGLIVILQRTHKKEVAVAAAERIQRMTTDQVVDPGLSPERRPFKTATGILAISRLALDPNMLSTWRVVLAGYVCKMVDNPPFQPNGQLSYSDTETASDLAEFDKWISTQRECLERDSARERQHLSSLAAEFHENVY
jgi:hypothetical protein